MVAKGNASIKNKSNVASTEQAVESTRKGGTNIGVGNTDILGLDGIQRGSNEIESTASGGAQRTQTETQVVEPQQPKRRAIFSFGTGETQNETQPVAKAETSRVFNTPQQTAPEQPLAPQVETPQATESAPQIPAAPEPAQPAAPNTDLALGDDLERTDQTVRLNDELSVFFDSFSPSDDFKSATPKKKDRFNKARIMSSNQMKNADKVLKRTVPPEPSSPRNLISSIKDLGSKRFIGAEDIAKSNQKAQVKQKGWLGRVVIDKLIANANLKLEEVSVGLDLVMAALAQPETNLLEAIEQSTGIELDPESPTLAIEIREIVNTSRIYVSTAKSPVNEGASGQTRVLRIHSGRGIELHPAAAKSYNADFDGDELSVAWDQKRAKNMRHAMSYVMGQDGHVMLDPDFFIIPIYNGDVTKEELKEAIISHMFKDSKDLNLDEIEKLVDAVAALYYIHREGAGKKLSKDELGKQRQRGWDNLVTVISRVVGERNNIDDRNRVVSDVLSDIYSGSRVVNMMLIESSLNDDDAGTYPIHPPVQYSADDQIYRIVNDLRIGRVPPNFQDFKIMMNKFFGEIEGKNVHFRIGADVAKMIKWEKDLKIGEGDFEELYELTMAQGMARRLSAVSNEEGKAMYASRVLRSLVIEEVGMPNDPRYNNFVEFIDNFRKSYERYSSMINLANKTFYMNRGVDSGPKNYDVKRMQSHEIKDIANCFLNIYGDYTVDYLFGNYVEFFKKGTQKNRGEVFYTKKNDFTKLVKNIRMMSTYSSMTLSAFSRNNRFPSPEIIEVQGAFGPIQKFARNDKYMAKRYTDNPLDLVADLLLFISDKRSSSAFYYNKIMTGNVGEGSTELINRDENTNPDKGAYHRIAKIVKRIGYEVENGTKWYKGQKGSLRDWSLYIDDLTELLYSFNPKLFFHFNMDSPQAFFKTHFGQKLIKAKDTKYLGTKYSAEEYIGSIHEAMLVQERLDKIRRRQELIDAINNNDVEIKNEDTIYNALVDYNLEMQALASSSMVWQTISKEMVKGENSVWNEMIKTKGSAIKGYCGSSSELNAKTFWSTEIKHKSLVDFILDTSVPKIIKDNVVSDVVRADQRFIHLKGWEVAYQLELDAANVYENIQAYSEGTSVFDVVKAFNSKADENSGRNRKAVKENFEECKALYKDKPETLNLALEVLSRDYNFCYIHSNIFINAISYVLTKTFNVSEKSSQSPGPDSLYRSLIFQKLGTNQSDVARSDNGLLGVIAPDQITPRDILKVLADKTSTEYFITYDELGNSIYVDRQTLTGGTSEAQLWAFFENNQRLFAHIKQHRPNIYGKSKKTNVNLVTTASSAQTIEALVNSNYIAQAKLGAEEKSILYNNKALNEVYGELRSVMMDHYRFAGMVALFCKTERMSSGAMQNIYESNFNMLLDIIVHEAMVLVKSEKDGNPVSLPSNEELMMKLFNLPKISDKERSFNIDENQENPIAGLPDVMYAELYDELASTIRSYIEDEAVKIVKKRPRSIEAYDIRDDVDYFNDEELYRPDLQSISMYYDVKQELSGAKTAASTGVEGMETYKSAFWVYLLSKPDQFIDPEDYTYNEFDPFENIFDVADPGKKIVSMFEGCMTNLGEPIRADNIERLIETAGDFGLVIETPEGFIPQDNTLERRRDHQIPSLGRYFIVKRDKGAEEFNLKVKKFGDDKTDSISKVPSEKFFDPKIVYDDVLAAYEFTPADAADGMALFNARVRLAEYMLTNDRNLGYTDMGLAEYTNLAEYMVIEAIDETGNKTIKLRTMEQIIHYLKNNISLTTIESADIDALRAEAQSLLTQVPGISINKNSYVSDSALRILGNVRIAPQKEIEKTNTAVFNANASSQTRNFELIKKITEYYDLPTFNERQIEKAAKKLTGIYSDKKGFASEKDANGREYRKSIFDYVGSNSRDGYIFLGVIGKEKMIQPGPTSVWVLSPDPEVSDAQIEQDFEEAKKYGITIMFNDIEYLSYDLFEKYSNDIIHMGDGVYQISFFDGMLNGSYFAEPPAPGSWQDSEDSLVISCEDEYNEFSLGDSMAKAFSSLKERIHPNYRGTIASDLASMFADTLNTYKPADPFNNTVDFRFEFLTEEDIRTYIVNNYDPSIRIDYGLSVLNHSYEEENERMQRRIAEYRENYSGGQFITRAKPDQIVGWMRCLINPGTPSESVVLAPIIPFRDKFDKKHAPSEFEFTVEFSKLKEQSAVEMSWSYAADSLDGLWLKMHEGAGAANKMMVRFDNSEETRYLKNGQAIDLVYAKNTTASRRLGYNKRLSTLTSLCYLARMKPFGYNFAEHADAFPDDPAFKEKLAANRLPWFEWEMKFPSVEAIDGYRFHNDAKIDAFLKGQMKKLMRYKTINPSDYLCSMWNGEPYNVWFEFDAMHGTNMAYQDGLLAWLNSMNQDLCPPSIEDSSPNYFFRVNKGSIDSFDYNCMLVELPHISVESGETFYRWGYVYVGKTFGGEDFAGMTKPNPDGSSEMLDLLSTKALEGTNPQSKRLLRILGRYATAGRSRVDLPHNITWVEPDHVKRANEDDE